MSHVILMKSGFSCVLQDHFSGTEKSLQLNLIILISLNVGKKDQTLKCAPVINDLSDETF